MPLVRATSSAPAKVSISSTGVPAIRSVCASVSVQGVALDS